MIKTRTFPACNYFAIQDEELNIFRFRIKDDEEIAPLEYPDVVDISLGDYCTGGCQYCYASATKRGNLYKDVSGKIARWLDPLSKNQRPFQIAIGGGGEPTLHHSLPSVLKTIRSYDVIPSYTTAGIEVPSDYLLECVQDYAGGMAVTAHEHINYVPALLRYLTAGVRTNIHCIVGQSTRGVDTAKRIRDKYPNVHTVVLLPFVNIGYAINTFVNGEEIRDALVLGATPGFAIGAMFSRYEYKWPELFEPYSMFDEHKFSGYIKLDKEPLKILNSSFDERERVV